ncbi:MAG: LON peptidase substrate-binding domain-containing protein [Candidatus Eisenbacteria bacterium]
MPLVPLFPLDLVLLPGGEIALHIFEPRYKALIARVSEEPIRFCIVRVVKEGIATVGCDASILRVVRRYDDGRLDLKVRGHDRLQIGIVGKHADGYLEADVTLVPDEAEEGDHALEDRVEKMFREVVSLVPALRGKIPPRAARWSYRIADRLQLSDDRRQQLLELNSENARMRALGEYLKRLLPLLRRQQRAQGQVKGNGHLGPKRKKTKEKEEEGA